MLSSILSFSQKFLYELSTSHNKILRSNVEVYHQNHSYKQTGTIASIKQVSPNIEDIKKLLVANFI